MVPIVRRVTYPPEMGVIVSVDVRPNQVVPAGFDLLELYNHELFAKYRGLLEHINGVQAELEPARQAAEKQDATGQEKIKYLELKSDLAKSREERDAIYRGLNFRGDRSGRFIVKAPEFTTEENKLRTDYRMMKGLDHGSPGRWTILNHEVKEALDGKRVEPTTPLLRLGDKEGGWEIELLIPQKYSYQVQKAFVTLDVDVLDVDLKVRSEPTRTFKGRLHRNRVGAEAQPNRDDNNEAEPVVIAYVSLDDEGILEKDRVPLDLRTSGIEVLAKVRCGEARLGYALFYGVWEFICEKVLFSF
jgi:hypothetical protein